MIKRYFFILFIYICFLFSVLSGFADESNPIISIGGVIQSPIRFTMTDLSRFRQVSISLEYTADKNGHKKKEAFKYTGVPLRTLLELAKIQKYEFEENSKADNKVPTVWRIDKDVHKNKTLQDIAVSVKNTQGKQIIISWGEIFFQNEDDIIFAIRKERSGSGEKIKQSLSIPELIFKHDFKKDRSLTSVCSIDVIRIGALSAEEFKKNRKPYIFTEGNEKISLSEMFVKSSKISVSQVKIKTISGNRKYSYSGVSISDIIDKFSSIKSKYTTCVKIVSKHGEVTTVSYGELQAVKGQRIILSESNSTSNEPVYRIIFPDDESHYRWIDDIHHIEILDLKQKAGIYVVGVGCGDTILLTSEAISYMSRADAFICMEGYKKSLAGYMAGKPVLFDPFLQLGKFYKKKHPELSDDEAEIAANGAYKKDMEMIRTTLDEGKIIVLLEPGDPTLYGGWRNWLSPNFPKETIKVITGISSFNVANAMLGEINLTNGSLIITEPESIKANESLIQSTAQSGDVIVIFMGLGRMKDLLPQFNKYFTKDTPAYLIYYAGIAGKERKIKTTLERVVEDINSNNENFLGLIYIGKNLDSLQDSGSTRKFISDK